MRLGRHRGRRRSVLVVALVSLCVAVGGCADIPARTDAGSATRTTRPLALVYRGPGGCASCSAAAAALLRSTRWGFRVRFVGPEEELTLNRENLAAAAVYVQPGGVGTVDRAFDSLRSESAAIRSFVASGGRYLGLCMGGYLAGKNPGFDLLPGDSGQFITSPGASVTSEADTIVKVNWRNRPRFMYFQDGPFFTVNRAAAGLSVLATYTNGEISALVAPYGKGRIGVSGPHPEATGDWYQFNDVDDPDDFDADLGRDLVDTLMRQ